MTSEKKIALLSKKHSVLVRAVSVATSFLLASSSFALGLGEIRVRSGLGQTLLAHSDLVGSESEPLNPSCLKAKIHSIDGQFIANANVSLYTYQSKRALSFTTRQVINEPAVILIVDIQCEVQLHREFSILLDPPDTTHSVNQLPRDESPFGVRQAEVAASAKNETATSSSEPKRASSKTKIDLGVEPTPVPDGLALPKKTKASKRSAAKPKAPVRDVLKLSDDDEVPEHLNLPAGLRMSDVLSTESGRELLQNTEELRAAQARMAAILRDEPLAATSSNSNDVAAIAQLKKEAEALRRQSALDKTALEALQNKSQYDLWLVLLAGIGAVAVALIGFLLYYIRTHLKRSNSTWWENNTELAKLDAESDSLIPDFKLEASQAYSTRSKSESAKDSNGVEDSTDTLGLNTGSHAADSGFHRTPTLEETNSSIFNFFSPRGTSVKVEEISDVTQEAEFWISMNDPRRAIEILEPQENVEEPDSPVPWLYLLDLYRTVEDAEKYNQLRDRFIVHFNANIPEFDADLANLPHRQLEDFEHLVSRISALWESHEIIPYLESLLVDDREGKRAGFDLPVYRDILMLLGIAHELERVRAIEAEMQGVAAQLKEPAEQPDKKDPVSEAEFNMIEFESIDFPSIDLEEIRKKK